MKKVVSVFLALLMLIGCAQLALAANDQGGLVYPTVYIRGKTTPIYNNIGSGDEWMVSDSSRVFSKEVTDIKAYAVEQAKDLLPDFAIALATKNYDPWAKKMSKMLEPIYRDFVLDKSGKPQANSGVKFSYTDVPNKRQNGIFPVNLGQDYSNSCYVLEHDWRLSPIDNAAYLKTYIDAILAKTGAEKFNLVTRCEGCCIALSFLYKYPEYKSKIANNVMLGSSANGVVYCSNIFAGKFNFNSDAINRYIGRNFNTDSDNSFGNDLFGDDAALRTFLKETLTLLSVTDALDLPGDKIVELVNKLAPMVVPGLLMSSYGTCPSYWAMVRDDDYEDAKKIAGLTGNPEWAAFVELIDDYHYNVQQKSTEILKDLEENYGVTTALAVKYGSETLPFIQDCDEINDDTTLAKDASYGAVTAKIGQTLTDAQLAGVDPQYISPDRMIDTSKGAFPDTTWYFKYYRHTMWSGALNQMTYKFIVSNGSMRIGDEGAPARFQIGDGRGDQAQPMTEENATSQSNYYKTDKLASLFSFLVALIPMLQRLFNLIKSKLGN